MTLESMETDEHEKIVRMLRESEAVRFGEFTLTSGRRSNVYVDIKRVWTDPDRLRLIAQSFARRLKSGERLAGMELGAVPLVVATALETGRSYVVLRKQARDHGTQTRIEGDVPPTARFVLLEDVTTTGGSLVESVELLRSAGARIDRALVVVDRGEGAIARLHEISVSLEPLVTLDEVRAGRP